MSMVCRAEVWNNGPMHAKRSRNSLIQWCTVLLWPVGVRNSLTIRGIWQAVIAVEAQYFQ